MSKSKGNVVNPLALVDEYGADALRMALVMSSTAGHDSSMGISKVKGMRNFSNKVWNAARYVLLSREQETAQVAYNQQVDDHMRLVETQVSQLLEEYKIGLAAETAHNEFWHWYCDQVIELVKNKQLNQQQLESCMQRFLVILHPFIPFVTEAIWKELGYASQYGLLISYQWPSN